MLQHVAKSVLPKMDSSKEGFWIAQDGVIAKKGKHWVGVTRQYCCVLGKQENGQVPASDSVDTEHASLPVACQLRLAEERALDKASRINAKVPTEVNFATKTEIALGQFDQLLSQGAPQHFVLVDAGYGVDTGFRERLDKLAMPYVVGMSEVVWPLGVEPLPPKP